MPSILTWIGSLLMLHGAYSCLHYRGILQDLDLEDSESYPIPPKDVTIEVSIAFIALLLGELLSAGKLQPVEVISKNPSKSSSNHEQRKPLQAPTYLNRDFDIYANRGKVL